MPIFEYQCSAGHRFERIVRSSDTPVTPCKQCPLTAEKVIAAPSPFQWANGKGWN